MEINITEEHKKSIITTIKYKNNTRKTIHHYYIDDKIHVLKVFETHTEHYPAYIYKAFGKSYIKICKEIENILTKQEEE